MNNEASEKLNAFKRISFNELNDEYNEDVFLYDEKEQIIYKNDKVYTQKGESLKDLLRVIKIIDPLQLKYTNTSILVPRVYAEKHNPIPEHISVQCLMFHKIKETELQTISKIIENTTYNKIIYDTMWIENEKNFSSIKENDILYIMNRRVGGWDGSLEHPVIELLCAGGHLPTIWDNNTNNFKTLNFIKLLQKEIHEEVGINVLENQFIRIGGFHNKVSNELVVLYALFIDFNQLLNIIEFAKGNYEENIDGVYLGTFEDVMNLYNKNPDYFAGREKAKQSNFPSNRELMKKIKDLLEDDNEKEI